jgi:hypothetical protein
LSGVQVNSLTRTNIQLKEQLAAQLKKVATERDQKETALQQVSIKQQDCGTLSMKNDLMRNQIVAQFKKAAFERAQKEVALKQLAMQRAQAEKASLQQVKVTYPADNVSSYPEEVNENRDSQYSTIAATNRKKRKRKD